MEKIYVRKWKSPVGEMLIGSFGEAICMCDWVESRHHELINRRFQRFFNAEYAEGSTPVIERAISQLEEYFSGKRRSFDIPVAFAGTDFQRRVWAELMKVSYGTTVSYAELAQRIGSPDAVRAVANCNATNPISIFVPCHRVIGSNGTLTGYGGGLSAKSALLRLESLHPTLF